MKKKALSSAVRIALSVGLAAAASSGGTVFAQETAAKPASKTEQATPSDQKDATNLSAVVVTGSHIRRVDVETANPVFTVDREAIEASGDLTLGKLVQDLPGITGGFTNPQVNNGGGTGDSTVSLRGLGPERTLILIDGHRVVSGDVNSIPAAMIERIEVLKDGASAVYGSDAIGGVINFITKKNYDGIQFTGNYGESSHADGISHGFTLTLGHATDKGNVTVGIGHNHISGVEASQRWFAKNALSILAAPDASIQTSIGGSASSPYGDIQLPKNLGGAFPGCASGHVARDPDKSGRNISDYHCYINDGPNSDKYNYASVNLIMTPQERTDGFILGSYNLSSKVSAYLDAFYNKTRSSFQIAPGVFVSQLGVNISKDNFYNPFGIDYGPQAGSFGSRLTSVGNRAADYATRLFQISTGLKGDFTMFDQSWNWDVGMDYGHISQTATTNGLVNLNKLYMGPSFKDASGLHCGRPGNIIENCVATFDPFNLQSPNSVAALKNAATPIISTNYSQEKILRAQASGGLFDLPAGTAQLALGVSYRKEHTKSLVSPLQKLDPETGTCILGSGCTSGLAGGFNVKEIYGELFIPILQGRPGAYGLNVTIGDRYSRFNSFGSTNNTEFKIEWRPIHSLLLRGTVAEVFRAPNIGELYGNATTDSPLITNDPCNGYTGNPVNPTCVNVPTDGSFVDRYQAQNLQAAATASGAKYAGFPIKPESGKSFDIGAVYSPDWAPGFSGGLDFWHIYLNDIITTVHLQSELNLCNLGQTIYCQFIHRIPAGVQKGQIAASSIEPTGNLGTIQVGGVDTTLTYKLDTGSYGRFRFMLNATYLKYYDQQTAPGLPGNTVFHDAGHYLPFFSAPATGCPGSDLCLFPRIQGIGTARWQKGNWSASWRIHYIGGFRMGSQSPSQDVHPAGSALDGIEFDYGATIYNDVNVGYTIKPLHTRVDLGVRNLFDKQPPMLYANNTNNSNTDAAAFDLMGRYYWARLTVSF